VDRWRGRGERELEEEVMVLIAERVISERAEVEEGRGGEERRERESCLCVE